MIVYCCRDCGVALQESEVFWGKDGEPRCVCCNRD